MAVSHVASGSPEKFHILLGPGTLASDAHITAPHQLSLGAVRVHQVAQCLRNKDTSHGGLQICKSPKVTSKVKGGWVALLCAIRTTH